MRLWLILSFFALFVVLSADVTTSDNSEYFLLAANQAEEEWMTKRPLNDSKTFEEKWWTKPSPLRDYSGTIKKLCDQLSEMSTEKHEQRGKNWYATMQTIAGRFFAKEESDISAYLGHQMNVARTLSNLPHEIPDEITLDNMRSTTFRLVMIVMERVRRLTIPNYVLSKIHPIAGWAAGLSDAELKEREEKIRGNNKNAIVNMAQMSLQAIQRNQIPMMERLIIMAYSRRPIRYEELRDYLIFGRYTPLERARIFATVEKTSGERLPSFFDTPATELIGKQ